MRLQVSKPDFMKIWQTTERVTSCEMYFLGRRFPILFRQGTNMEILSMRLCFKASEIL